jgi:DNA polymerase-3 subunit gamma/tau
MEGLVEGSDAEVAELRALAARAEPARLRRMFRALLREQEDLAWAPQTGAVLEMAVVRLASLPEGEDAQALLARLDALERRLAEEPPASPGASRSRTGGPGGGGPAPRAGERSRGGGPASRSSPEPEDAPEEAADAVEESAAPAEPHLGPDAPLAVVFDRLRVLARREDRALAGALDGGELVELSNERLCLALPNAFAARRLERRAPDLERLASRLFGRPVRVVVRGPEEAPPGEAAQRGVESDLARRRRQEALDHPAVNSVLEVLGGDVEEIRPLGPAG